MAVNKPQLNLANLVLQDLWRHALLVLFAFTVIGLGVYVVYLSHDNRQLTTQWDLLLQERDRLDIEWRNLLLEEQSLSEHSRITRIATKELDMNRPLPKEEVIVRVK